MKKARFLAMMAVAMAMVCPSIGRTVVDVYNLTAALIVPQVLDNSDSKGRRVYRRQMLKGSLLFSYKDEGDVSLEVQGLSNLTFKVSGACVTYTTSIQPTPIIPLLAYIGDNSKVMFNVATTCFYLEALPSYVSSEPDADNSFYLTFSGRGPTTSGIRHGALLPKTLMGYVAGTQGCGCSCYGHISPTRAAGVYGPTEKVIDVASVFGQWRAIYSHSTESD